MKRILAMGLLLFVAALVSAALSQEPPNGEEPVRLKRKTKPGAEPKTEPEKPAAKAEKKQLDPEKTKDKSARDDEPSDEDADDREVLERIARNLKIAEERLANRELGDSTRQVQEDVLKDIDSLLKKAGQAQDQSDGAGESSQDQDQGKQSQGKGQAGKSGSSGKSGSTRSSGKGRSSKGGKQSAKSGKQQRGSGQMSKGKGGNQPKQGTGATTAKNDPMGKGGNEPGGGGKGQEGPPNRAADVYKDIWGHLPESLRSEMNAYFNDKQFMAKYDDLIKRYYSAIAEKGRRKER